MATKTLLAVIILCLLILSASCMAQETAAGVSVAQARGWDEAWSWGNAFAVKTYFEQLYYPHAIALLDAEKQLGSAGSSQEILKSLSALPGVKAAVLSRVNGRGEQFPEGAVKIKSFDSALFHQLEDRALNSTTPMLRRAVGGKARFAEAPTSVDSAADLLVRYVVSDTSKPPAVAISLILDEKWLLDQIPSAMDSLYRENVQLLFAAASPLNKIWEQSLGVIAGSDTLWWVGRKDVKIANEQILWPFENIRVPSYVHTLNQK